MKLRDLDKFDNILNEHFSNDKGIKSGVKQLGKSIPAEQRKKIGNAMRGKTLEELVGEEKAIKGRRARSISATGKRDPAIGQKIAATRRANNSYGTSMLGKEHKESTKATMAIKAKIRQDLKRTLGMGREGKLPKELLEAEYKKHGL
jgi:hypothetical protein